METYAVAVKHLVKDFGSQKAVDDLSFTVPQGTITGFIGPNGAGKTTTLRMLATLMRPTRGKIQIFGVDMAKDQEKVRHKLGFMPDTFAPYDDMNVWEYLDFFGAAYHIPARKRLSMVEDLLALVDLSGKKDSLLQALSRGMQQRLALARCLVHDPSLLLLDEPASGLDPRARIELMELLKELRRMGKTIFISSHILAELKDLCDFVVIIERGKLVYHGTIDAAASSIAQEKKKLRLVFESKAEDAMAIVQKFDGVKEVGALQNTLMVEYEENKISSSQIIKALVLQGFEIQEGIKEKVNLEEVFMTLTQGGVS